MNFNIVEGDYTSQKLPEFVELYNQDTKVKDICRILNITLANYRNLRDKAKQEGLLHQRSMGNRLKPIIPHNINKGTHVQRNGKGYSVRRKGIHYCYIKNYKHGLKIVEELEKCNWDKSQVEEIKARVVNNADL